MKLGYNKGNKGGLCQSVSPSPQHSVVIRRDTKHTGHRNDDDAAACFYMKAVTFDRSCIKCSFLIMIGHV